MLKQAGILTYLLIDNHLLLHSKSKAFYIEIAVGGSHLHDCMQLVTALGE